MSTKTTIIFAPAGAGKSRSMAARLAEKLAAGDPRSALMLVPTADDARASVAGLLEKVQGVLPIPVANFYEFVARVLEHNQCSGKEISPAERNLLLQNIIENLARRGKIKYFAPLLRFSGLASAMGEFIKELKQNTIMPDQFLASAKRTSPQKGAEIAAIYSEYQRVLKAADLYDTEGRLWRVRDLIKAGKMSPYEKVEEVFIDNFANFTPSEFDIIKALSARVKSVTFAVTCEDGARRRELFETTSSTIALIEKEFPGARKAALEAAPREAGSLAVLHRNLFDPLAEKSNIRDGRIRITRCPNRTSEVVETGRRIKSLIRGGTKPDDIVIVLRSLANYAPLFEEIFREQGIPFSIANRRRLSEIPLIRGIMHLLEIPTEDFSRHAVMRFLRSHYARAIIGDFDPSVVDRVSIEAQITAGLDSWRGHVQSHARRLEDLAASPDIGDDLPDEPERLNRRLSEARQARDFLDSFFARLEALTNKTTIAGYAERVLSLTDTPLLRDACIDPTLPQKTGEDLAALAVFREELRHLAAFAETLGISGQKFRYEEFLDNLRLLMDSAIDASRARPDGRVRIMEVPETRGLFFPVVFVCGLVEKEFPRQTPPSPFYNDAARAKLNREGSIFLSEHSAGQKFEMFLFYTAVTRATERLYLTHPLVDPEGREAMPSYYLTEVERLFDRLPAKRISLAKVLPRHRNAASPREMLAALLADADASRNPARFLPERLSRAGKETPPLALLARSLTAVHARDSSEQPGVFDGVIADAEIQKRLKSAMRDSVLSASQLSLYGACPFRYFAERILGLEEIREPEDDLTSINKGTLFHGLLHDFFTRLREEGSTVIREEDRESATRLIVEMANDCFERFRSNGMVANETVFRAEQSEILEILREFVNREAVNNSKDKTRATPAHFELAFGFDKILTSWDPQSTGKPLIIRGGEFPIRIRGRIDRLDRRHDGWVIIDYKTGSSPGTKADFEEGSDLQLPIYTIAVNELFSLDHAQAVDGFYYVLRYFRRSGRLAKNLAELCDKAKEHAMAHVAKISAGRFPPTPRDDSTCGSCPACGICAYSESRAERKSPDEDGPD